MPINLDQVNCLLFDLDGTLLPMNMDVFIEAYIRSLTVRAAAYIPPESFPKYLWAATGAMIESSDPDTHNHEIFWLHFSRFARHPRQVLEPVFEEFYLSEFPALINTTQPSPVAREVVNLALGRGKQVVLATNPIFPGIAVRERMRWAGIHDLPWLHVTNYENSRYCKPNPAYYQDLLQQLSLSPGECLMIGNDVQEDLVASELGIATCLVTDCLLDKCAPAYQPDWRGGLGGTSGLVEGFIKKGESRHERKRLRWFFTRHPVLFLQPVYERQAGNGSRRTKESTRSIYCTRCRTWFVPSPTPCCRSTPAWTLPR